MKKIIPLLLCALMLTALISSSTAFAQDEIDFASMTPQAQYAYLQTLGSQEEKDAALATLTDTQLAALAAYEQSLPPDDTGESEAPAESKPFAEMTVEEQYAYLQTLGSQEEKDAALATLTEAQLAALAAYEQSLDDTENESPPKTPPAVNYTDAGSFFASYGLLTVNQPNEDNLMLKKTISEDNGSYTLAIEAYATGQVTITTGEEPTPTDIIMVLDISGSMNSNMPDENIKSIVALKDAANNFIDKVVEKSDTNVNHRIAVITYASDSFIISGDQTADGAFVDAYNNSGGIYALKDSISALTAQGSQAAVSGLDNAISIFDVSESGRNRVVIYLTGGVPNGNQKDTAIQYAHDLKASDGYGATVYSIGVFRNANPTIPLDSTTDDNRFMHFISSNYPDAMGMGTPGTGSIDAGYYLSATNTAALNDIFYSISEHIESGTTSTLDDTAVVKDIITSYFDLPEGADAGDIHVYTSTVDEQTGAWQQPVLFLGAEVVISPDHKTVSVSGFDYSDNYYAAIETNGEVTGYQGTKLIVEIPLSYIKGSCFGGTVPTNEELSGIYEDDILVENLPIPTVDIPVDYDFTPLDVPIYITQSTSIADLFTTATGYVADGINNAYVKIVYTVSDSGGTALGTYTIPAGAVTGSWAPGSLSLDGLTANTPYTVSCTVTPVSPTVTSATIDKPAAVYVWTPELTYCDSVIYLGQNVDYSDNAGPTSWINSANNAPSPTGPAPALACTYTPAAGAFASDTHVAVAVAAGGVNITGHTSFVHEVCTFSGCGFDPAQGQFMVHVKTCSLTITKAGASDPTDTFIFLVTGEGLSLRVSVQGDGSATITGLAVGNYTVTEDAGWSWRYTADSKTVTLCSANASGQVSVSNEVTNHKWLGGDSWAANLFSED